MRRQKISFADLELAFESSPGEMQNFLDLETGAVVSYSDEELDLLKRITASHMDEQSGTVDWEAGFREEHVPDWQREVVREAGRVEADAANRYVEIPTADSHEEYRDMEDFVGTVRDQHLQGQLEQAIGGRGAFRRFKDVLLNYPAERERWFEFRDGRMRGRLLEWLGELGIKPAWSQDQA